MLRLPDAPYRPGRTPRPPADQFDALIAALPVDETPLALARSAAFRAGFTAFEAGYFWEAHELWEPIWMRLAPQSPERHLLQGLIQLANARLKAAMNQERAARRILARAQAAIDAAYLGRAAPVMGLGEAEVRALTENKKSAL